MEGPPLSSDERLMPLGYWRDASDFHRAATLAFGPTQSGMPSSRCGFVPWFLLGHAIELGLKAFLLTRGLTKENLRSKKLGFSHDLENLYAAARQHGLESLPDHPRHDQLSLLIATICVPHKERSFAYHRPWFGAVLPMPDLALETVSELLRAVRRECPNA